MKKCKVKIKDKETGKLKPHPFSNSIVYLLNTVPEKRTVEGFFKDAYIESYGRNKEAKKQLVNMHNGLYYINQNVHEDTLYLRDRLGDLNAFFGREIFKFNVGPQKADSFRQRKGYKETQASVSIRVNEREFYELDATELYDNVVMGTEEEIARYESGITAEEKSAIDIHAEALERQRVDFPYSGLEGQEQRDSIFDEDTLEDLNAKIDILSKSLNVTIVIDADIPYSRLDAFKPGQKPVIRINPKKIFKDTVIHEFGHLYIDLLGGENNSFIQRAFKSLRDTNLYREVASKYPHLKGVDLDKEVLATAIGREGAEIFDKANKTSESIVARILNVIKELLGIDVNYARKLANELLSNKVRKLQTSEWSNFDQLQKNLTKEEQVVETAMDALKKRIFILEAQLSRTPEGDVKKSREKHLNNLKALFDELPLLEARAAIVQFSKNAVTNIALAKSRLERISSEEADIRDFKLLRDHINIYGSIVSDILQTASTTPELSKVLDESNLTTSLKEIASEIIKIDRTFKEQAIDFMADKMSRTRNRITGKYIRQYEEEFKNLGSNLKGAEYNAEEAKYVTSMLLKNEELIRSEAFDYFKNILITNPRDLGMLDSLATNPKNLNDDIIQQVVELIDKNEFETNKTLNERIKLGYNFHKLFIAERGRAGVLFTDSKKLYDPLIEDEVDENGVKTGKKDIYIVSEYYSKFYTEKERLGNLVNWNAKDFRKSQEYQDYISFLEKNTTEYANYKEYLRKNPSKKVDYSYYVRNIAKSDFKPTDKWKNPQYTALMANAESATTKMYNFIVETNKIRDSRLFGKHKLYYEMPSISKKTTEKIGEDGIIAAIKDGWKDLNTVRADDKGFEGALAGDNYTEVLADEKNKIRRSLPILYRNRKGISKDDQSYDLLANALLDFGMATNYSNKLGIQQDIEIIRELVAERETIQRDNTGTPFMDIVKEKILKSRGADAQQNTLRALDSIIETRLYGITNLGNPKAHKWVNWLLKWNGSTTLSLNYFSGLVNINQGKIMNFIESAGRGIYGRDDLRTAEVKYFGDSINWTKDIVEQTAMSSKTNLLHEKYQLSDINVPDFIKNSALKRMAGLQSLNINNRGEHYIQNTMMYAILNTYKVTDANGNYLTATGTTTDAKEAMTLDEAYTAENGKLTLDPRVKGTNKTGLFNENTEFEIADLIQRTSLALFGNYFGDNKALIQRYAGGKMAIFLKRWLEPGYKRRLRGMNIAFKSDEEREQLGFFNKATMEIEEGYYTTAIRYIKEIIKSYKTERFRAFSGAYKKMTDYERANIMKTSREALFIIAAVSIAGLAEAAAEEEDDEETKKLYYMVAFLSRKTYSELFTYVHPYEASRTALTPTASETFITDLLNVAEYLMPWSYDNWNDRYLTGKRKGKLKVIKELEDIIPILKQTDRTWEDAYKFLTK